MTQTAPTISSPREETAFQRLLNCTLMMALGALLCSVTFQNYRVLQEYGSMRTNCVVAAVVAGIGIAFAFGGAMHYADLLLGIDSANRPHILLRMLLVVQKRLMLFLQIAAAALVLEALGAVLFDLAIPGPDYSMLYKGGYTPPQLPIPISQ